MNKVLKSISLVVLMSFVFCSCSAKTEVVDNGTTLLGDNGPAISAYEIEGVKETMVNPNTVEISIKDYGIIQLELDEKEAPITVANFKKLVSNGFYDGLTFHRIISGFMIQGGDPLGNGRGGSGEEIKGEFKANGVDNNISHVRGVISMARSQMPDSASSQFFIVHQDSTFLDGQYAAFGHVIKGIECVDAICENVIPVDDNGTIPSENQPVIEYIKMLN